VFSKVKFGLLRQGGAEVINLLLHPRSDHVVVDHSGLVIWVFFAPLIPCLNHVFPFMSWVSACWAASRRGGHTFFSC